MKYIAFDIWTEHENMLRNYIRRRVADPADAEDVLQTVLLKIHRYFETNSDVVNLRPWLYQVCYHNRKENNYDPDRRRGNQT